jgi:MoxR-like ATPase
VRFGDARLPGGTDPRADIDLQMADRSTDLFAEKLQTALGRVLVGKADAIQLALTTLLARGHLLIEDRPGVGKTLLARALARCLDLPFQRVQCTADLLPADILGAPIYQPSSGEITFRRGPVFTSVLVADELNRTPPRTQSALLECMQERRVTIDRESFELPDPFMVVATQNPLTFAGTYPLPESQLDRFLMRIRIGYPETEDEISVVAREDGHEAMAALAPVASVAELRAAQDATRAVTVHHDVVAYIVELADRTRSTPEIRLGVSPRGAQALHRACRARAVVFGRDYATPDDVRALAGPVFAHRMIARGGDGAADALLAELLGAVAAPD